MTIRSNPQIWRLAEYLFAKFNDYPHPWSYLSQRDREEFYDKAAELLKKIESKDFVGQDQHGD